MLATAILGLVKRARRSSSRKFEVRVIEAARTDDPHYVFVVVKDLGDVSYERYRERRRALLQASLPVVKLMKPGAIDIVGVAFGEGVAADGSEDLMHLGCRDWAQANEDHAVEIQRKTGILSSVKRFLGNTPEYRDVRLTGPGRCGGGDQF